MKSMKPNKLSQSHPAIAKGWDSSRNIGLTPNDVNAHSRQNVWWLCASDHAYQVSVTSRVRSNGCKVCQKQIYLDKQLETKLASSQSVSQHSPKLLKEWNYIRNKGINPDKLSYGSNKKVWWKCNEGHEWEVAPKTRTKGSNCPVCGYGKIGSARRIAAIKKAGQSFAKAYPDLLKEWDFEKNTLSPEEIPPKSSYRASWICKYTHKWDTTVTNRTNNHSNCPECNPQTSRIEIYILCEIRSIFPNTQWRRRFDGVECDIYIPEVKLGIEIDGSYWHDEKLNKDTIKNNFFENLDIQLVRVRDILLPEIDGEQISFSKTEPLQDVTNRVIALLAGTNDAFQLYAGTQQKEAHFKEMIARLPAPPDGESLIDTHPAISQQWDFDQNAPLTPDLFSKGSNQKFWWKCEIGHLWEAAINNRAIGKSGCPECYLLGLSERMRRIRLKKTLSLVQASPAYLKWYDLNNNELPPSEIAIKSSVDIWWRCDQNHRFMKKPINMANNHECPTCNTLPVKFPEIAAQWNYNKNEDEPAKFHSGSGAKVWWLCDKGHEWETVIAQRTGNRKEGCPQCYNEKRPSLYRELAVKRNGSLSDLNPDYLSEWDYTKNIDITPNQVTVKSKLNIWWKCHSGHSYQQSLGSKARGSICTVCNKSVRAESVRLSRLKKSGSLQDNFPNIASHWHPSMNGGLTANGLTSGSNQKVWWKCANQHEWEAKLNTMTDKKRTFICPVCRNKKDHMKISD